MATVATGYGNNDSAAKPTSSQARPRHLHNHTLNLLTMTIMVPQPLLGTFEASAIDGLESSDDEEGEDSTPPKKRARLPKDEVKTRIAPGRLSGVASVYASRSATEWLGQEALRLADISTTTTTRHKDHDHHNDATTTTMMTLTKYNALLRLELKMYLKIFFSPGRFSKCYREEDILKVQHKTTLGPYSFDLFVAAVWSADRVENLPATKRTPVIYGKSVRKRPRAISLKGKENKMPNKKKRLSLLFAALRVPVGEEQLEEEEEEEDEEEDEEDEELSSDDEEA
ncbi:hypothetical protein BDZ89DRAFT_1053921 [Hymenopellis radicata]|nr:hypothetical protein BDZ89DRAFT_1053921 [Hymenopellis radicata]